MDALEMTLLFDYYGDLLTERQRVCFDLRHNQDMSLAEIAEELQVSRQSIHDILTRTEAQLRNMEEKTGCVERDRKCRKAMEEISALAAGLNGHTDTAVCEIADRIIRCADQFEE
jgi:predicted DNA-binding protein YlxM (UPF0122 family)